MLQIENVTVRFGGVVAVDDVSLTVEEADLVGLVGPNGAGKTTLFNAISGLVRPNTGSIRLQDTNIRRMPLHRRARLGIGRTFQIPQPMHELTVRENLHVAQRFGTGATSRDKVDEVLAFLNLADKAEKDAATDLTLSELKALEVGKALVTEPKLLLLDEVLGGLETSSKRRFMDTILAVRARYKLGIIIIEHDIETIMTLCHRVCVLNFGRLIADGTPQEAFEDPEVIRSYTGGADA